jgi:hypothetical protein
MHARMRNWALMLCLLFLQACASTTTIQTARSQFFSGQTELALETLNEVAPSSKSRLLVQLDKGAIAFATGQYRESSRALLTASNLLDELDVVSVSEQTTSLVTNDWVTTYKGEYSERLWVHSLQMMNFLLLNEPESAAVEARQAIKLLDTYKDALKKDWFTRALIGLSFEAVGQLDSAHIEYKKLHKDAEQSSSIAHLAWNNAKHIGRHDDMKAMASGKQFDSFDSAVVLFINNGRIPAKLPGHILVDEDLQIAFPIYPEFATSLADISVSLNDAPVVHSPITTDLHTIAKASLAARGKRIAAKTALRAIAKKAVRDEARKEDALLGAFVSAALFIMEFPDIRSWETLPGSLSVVVIPVEPGTHTVSVAVNDGFVSTQATLDNIEVKRGQRVFRSFHPNNHITEP